jgi:hypothetical protein
LAMVCRSSRVFDSRSDLSGEGFAAIGIPFSPPAKVQQNGEENQEAPSWKDFRTSAKGRSRTTSTSVADERAGVNPCSGTVRTLTVAI